MSDLYIVGNGFDLAHGLPTSYQDFKDYLYLEYPNIINEPNYLLNPQTMPDGSEHYDMDEVVSFLVDIISKTESDEEKWSDLEGTLGSLDYSELIDTLSFITDGKENLFHKAVTFEDAINNLYVPMNKIKKLFSNWINTISINQVKEKSSFSKLINKEKNFFMTFNYTSLLENIYQIAKEQILHIHGNQDKEIIFGHGNIFRTFESYPLGSEFGLLEIHESLKKDTDKIMSENINFFQRLNSIKNIYSFGFSFSNVDLCYIEKILSHIDNQHLIWYLSDYNNEKEKDEIKKKIIECGYKGDFKIFHI